MTADNASPVDAFLAAVLEGSMASCPAWAPGAVLDATVPNWRFRRVGAPAISAEYAGWFADPGRFEELHRAPCPDGEVVEYLLTWVEKGVPHAAHHMHRFVVRDGKIVADTVMCGGRWPASLLAEMAGAALREESDVHA